MEIIKRGYIPHASMNYICEKCGSELLIKDTDLWYGMAWPGKYYCWCKACDHQIFFSENTNIVQACKWRHNNINESLY